MVLVKRNRTRPYTYSYNSTIQYFHLIRLGVYPFIALTRRNPMFTIEKSKMGTNKRSKMFSSGIQRVKVTIRKDAIPKYFLNNSDDEKFKEPIFIKSGKPQNYSKKCYEFNVYFEVLQILLTQFTPKFHFYVSLKPEETRFFLRFLRGCKNGKLV